jgi:ABC-type phosphate/phosphonate transport system substrate-binding protein
MIASLPMYDWPEVSDAVDRLWAAIRTALAEFGIDAPPSRSRAEASIDHWRDPSLLMSQTCGLPLRRHLADDVVVIGAFDHRLPDTAPGDYHSVVIVGADHPATSLVELREATAAVNGADSQSGHAALRHALIAAPDAVDEAIVSGSHRASIELVATGAADIAAIDAVSWELALAHEPAADRCRVLGRTEPTPGLPLITAAGHAALLPQLRGALALGLAAIDDTDRHALHAHALVVVDPEDYAVLDERWTAADRAGVPEFA